MALSDADVQKQVSAVSYGLLYALSLKHLEKLPLM